MLVYPGSIFSGPDIPDESSAAFCKLAALILAMGSQDPYTQDHARRVAAYAEGVANRLGLSAEVTETLRIGGLLHDIGKVTFSRELLCNTGSKLSPAMRTEIRRHPQIGVSLLESIHMATPVIECVRFHHERLDGSGYPYGLKAGEIPLGARIISVADCFDALTTDRPYQKGRTPAEALRIMERLGGKVLSPELVRALTEEIRQNGMHQV
jgi:putative nucleotidyltransferase with HDIG domain